MAHVLQSLVFYILAILCIASALVVVSSAPIVRSAFALVLTFTCIGGLYFNLNADFVAAAQILVYVGAITIIMLFGIMLTSQQESGIEETGLLARYVASVASIGLLAGLAYFISRAKWEVKVPTISNTPPVLGRALFSEYLLSFEVASIILLMAMIGALVLARKGMKRS